MNFPCWWCVCDVVIRPLCFQLMCQHTLPCGMQKTLSSPGPHRQTEGQPNSVYIFVLSFVFNLHLAHASLALRIISRDNFGRSLYLVVEEFANLLYTQHEAPEFRFMYPPQ